MAETAAEFIFVNGLLPSAIEGKNTDIEADEVDRCDLLFLKLLEPEISPATMLFNRKEDSDEICRFLKNNYGGQKIAPDSRILNRVSSKK